MKLPPLVRVVARSLALAGFLAGALAAQILGLVVWKTRRTPAARARWLQRTAEGCRRILGVRVQCVGALPRRGLLVANHLSYLDIIVLAARRPCAFVSKNEVRAWPVFGWCAQLGGTIFVDRTRRGDVARISGPMRDALDAGLLVVLFPEGTSSGGASVLPFKSSLLEPAVHLRCPVSAAALAYALTEGSVSDEICYWRDMTLLPHLLKVMTKPAIHASVRVGIARPHIGDRKTLARELHGEVQALHEASKSAARNSANRHSEELQSPLSPASVPGNRSRHAKIPPSPLPPLRM